MDTPQQTPESPKPPEGVFHAAPLLGRICITCGDEYPGSWTGECNDCEQSTLALWLNFANAEKREDHVP